ncbi:hypothetical protein Ancab_022090 [Ancistrocladus abbreviatus]
MEQCIYIVTVEIEQWRREVGSYSSIEPDSGHRLLWRSVAFSHTVTFEIIIVDTEWRNEIQSDLKAVHGNNCLFQISPYHRPLCARVRWTQNQRSTLSNSDEKI